jgi:hypothetical protein
MRDLICEKSSNGTVVVVNIKQILTDIARNHSWRPNLSIISEESHLSLRFLTKWWRSNRASK